MADLMHSLTSKSEHSGGGQTRICPWPEFGLKFFGSLCMDTTFFFVSHRSNNSKRQKPKLFVTLLMARMLSQKIWHDPVLDSGMYILPSPTHQNEPFYFWCRDRIFIWNRKRMLFIGFPKGYKLMRSGTILTYSYPGKIANLTYADYLCVVSYILVNVV